MGRVCLLLVVAACGRLEFEQAAMRADADVDSNVAPNNCGSVALLADDFNDTMAGPLFTQYTQNGMTVSETAGAVSFVFAPSVGVGRYSGYDSAQFVMSHEICATLEVSSVPASTGLGYFDLLGGTQTLEFVVYQGNLELRTKESGTISSVGLFPYDASAHRFWRLRQQGGVTYWDVSADGITFHVLGVQTFFTQATARVSIGAGAEFSTATAGGRFTVERLSITQP